MGNTINQLIDAIIESGIDWTSIISAVCSIISLIAIIILLIERAEKTRPYLQATFELIKSNLVCITIKNVGSVPAVLKEISFNDEFVQQMSEESKRHLKNNESMNLTIFPLYRWIISLNVTTPEIFKKDCHTLKLQLKYSKSQKKKAKYSETTEINFDDYQTFMIYISETDELTKGINKMTEEIKELKDIIKKQTNTFEKPFDVNRIEDVGGEQKIIITQNSWEGERNGQA